MKFFLFLYLGISIVLLSEEEDAWIDLSSGESMKISTWHKERPSNDSLTNDCLYFITEDKTLYDYTCNFHQCCCPVCNIARVT